MSSCASVDRYGDKRQGESRYYGMNSQGTQGGSVMKRQTAPQNRPSPTQQKKQQQGFESVGAPPRKPGRVVSPGERTVKRLKLSKALTIPDTTTVADACRRMATRRVDAALLTDSNAILCGIITDKDVATRVVAEGLKPEVTAVSKANSGTCQWWSMARWWHC